MELILTIIAGALLFYVSYRLLVIANKRMEYTQFKKQYVVPFDPLETAAGSDPLSGEAFKEGELIVKKCERVCTLESWNICGGQCPHYPDCMNYSNQCVGSGAPTQTDNNSYWMARICIYGYLAWAIFMILNFYVYPQLSVIYAVALYPLFVLIFVFVYTKPRISFSFRSPDRKIDQGQKEASEKRRTTKLPENRPRHQPDYRQKETNEKIETPGSPEKNTGHGIINIVIKVMPMGDELDVELSVDTTGAQIIDELLLAGVAPRFDSEGVLYMYELISSKTNRRIELIKSLWELDIQNGEIIFMAPKLVAGGTIGLLMYDVPEVMALNKRNRCVVRVSGAKLKAYLLEKGLAPEAKLSKIEVGEIMVVSLTEYALSESLEIVSLNDSEQLITDIYYTEWKFDVIPRRIGFTALLLRISVSKYIELIGQKTKNVFTIDLQVEIQSHESSGLSKMDMIVTIDQVNSWSPYKKEKIIEYISKNDTGKALCELANFTQFSDTMLYHSIILLQAQYNEGRNKSLLNLIGNTEWWMLQSRINLAVLELINDIDNGQFSISNNIERIKTAQSYAGGLS